MVEDAASISPTIWVLNLETNVLPPENSGEMLVWPVFKEARKFPDASAKIIPLLKLCAMKPINRPDNDVVEARKLLTLVRQTSWKEQGEDRLDLLGAIQFKQIELEVNVMVLVMRGFSEEAKIFMPLPNLLVPEELLGGYIPNPERDRLYFITRDSCGYVDKTGG